MSFKLHILPLIVVVMFTSCSPVESEQMSKNTSSDYGIDEKWQISLSNFFMLEEEQYLVFIYSETCGHCHQIMGDVLEFSYQNIIPLYYLNISIQENKIPLSLDIDSTIGLTAIDDLVIAGTPSLIEVQNHAILANVAGADNCLTFLTQERLNKEK